MGSLNYERTHGFEEENKIYRDGWTAGYSKGYEDGYDKAGKIIAKLLTMSNDEIIELRVKSMAEKSAMAKLLEQIKFF